MSLQLELTAPTPTSSRCLAAFDLDPGKPDSLAFGARDHLSLCVTLRNELGMSSTSTLTPRLDDTADVGDRMAEAQLEAFDEDLFAEVCVVVVEEGQILIVGNVDSERGFEKRGWDSGTSFYQV